MDLLGRISGLMGRLGTYPWWEVLIEVGVIWLVVYFVFRFVQGTRAAGALKGILVLFVVVTLIARILSGDAFGRLSFLYDRFLGIVAIALVVIFQPELRRAVIRLGETPFFRQTPKDISHVVDNLTEACGYLAKAKFGAIIVLEAENEAQAQSYLDSLPLAQKGMLTFEVYGTKPYRGFLRGIS